MEIESIDPILGAEWILESFQTELDERALSDLVARTSGTLPPIFLAAVDQGRILGLVAFRRHSLPFGREGPLTAFQAAGVLTAAHSRGRGIFPAIIKCAEDTLRGVGGQAIFGFPNASAYPVWTTKLNYEALPLLTWRAPAFLRLDRLLISKSMPTPIAAVGQDDAILVRSKLRLPNTSVINASLGNSSAWAITREIRKLGRTFRRLDIGGIECLPGTTFVQLLEELIEMSGKPDLIRLQGTESCPIFKALRFIRKPRQAHEAIIFKSLDRRVPSQTPVAIYSGAAEWF